MAIEELSEISFVVKKRELKNFRNYLYKLGTVHIKDVSTLSEPPKVDINEEMLIREDLSKTDYIIKALEEVSPVKQSFIENFIPKRQNMAKKKTGLRFVMPSWSFTPSTARGSALLTLAAAYRM